MKKGKNSSELVSRTFKKLQRDYLVIGKERVHSWDAWLAIGFIAGVLAAVIVISNRSGEFDTSVAAIEESAAVSSYFPGRILVKFKEGVSDAEQGRLLKSWGLAKKSEVKQIKVKILNVPEGAEEVLVQALLHNPKVEYAELDGILKPELVPNDPYYSSEWHLSKIGSESAWDVTQGQASVVIAILDSGVDGGHPDLLSKLVAGYNFYSNNTDTFDVYGHGTKVAGVAAAVSNNGLGVASPAWINKIMPIRVSDASGYAYYSTISSGITWAADNGAKVMNVSFGGVAGSYSITNAANYAKSKGALVVAAAGNCSCFDGTPENTSMISVSATDWSDASAYWSSVGNYVDVSAPGTAIYTTTAGGGYEAPYGTSFSSPLTAGVIALMFSANADLTPADAEAILESTALDLGSSGYDSSFGWGRINAAAAVASAANNAPPPDISAPTTYITSPADGSTVSGTVSVTISASDNNAVLKVELWKDGTLFASDTSSPYSFSWNTFNEVNGLHTLQSLAYDGAGNVGYSGLVNVNVDNVADSIAPSVSINSPLENSKLPSRGNVNISVSASDSVGVTQIDILFDGVLRKSCYDINSCFYKLNTNKISAGAHTILARAYDQAENTGSAEVNVTK
ncbi:S8 family serine peptidase [Candidatus Giovannonibacteria bacterium]|nr:S8 family serine peptidase [Candidatus Giovannonibacteria bacterium]